MLTLDLYSSSIPVDPVTISTYQIVANLVGKMQLAIHRRLDIYWCLARLSKASLDHGTVQMVYVHVTTKRERLSVCLVPLPTW